MDAVISGDTRLTTRERRFMLRFERSGQSVAYGPEYLLAIIP